MTSDSKSIRSIAPDVRKFLLLNLITFGSYQAYWAWKNWEIVKRIRGTDEHTSVRGFFIVLTCWRLFKEILVLAKEKGYQAEYSSQALGVAFFAVTFISNRLTNSPSVGPLPTLAIAAGSIAIIAFVVNPVIKAMRYYIENSDAPAETFELKTNWPLIATLVAVWVVFFAIGVFSAYHG